MNKLARAMLMRNCRLQNAENEVAQSCNMNEPDKPETAAPPVDSTLAPLSSTYPKPASYWIKRLLVCNPFYLLSAALLLFGMYRISVDRNLFTEEISQLAFNLTSLEFYEALLVGTALFLAVRRIWYDSTLLVGLENALIFVPFILVSQVALISTRAVWIVCAVTAVLAVVRVGSLKRYFRELNLPSHALWLGAVLLLINIGLLATYRIDGEIKMGGKPDGGRDFVVNQFTWLVILPAALALINFLPYARENGSLTPQRRWLPFGLFSLWVLATGVHLYCLNYVYDFAFRIEMLAPACWILAWTAFRRVPDVFALQNKTVKRVLVITPMAMTFLAATATGNHVFFGLTLLNVAIYAMMCYRDRQSFAWHLLFASVVLLACGIPSEWMRFLAPVIDRPHYIAACVAIYFLIYNVVSRNPKIGFLGAILVTLAVAVLFSAHNGAGHWAVQAGLVFLLLHSLGWVDDQHQGARATRILAAAFWVSHAVIWVRSDMALWAPCVPGGLVFVSYLVAQLLRGGRGYLVLPAASILVALSGPGNYLVGMLQYAPAGLLAVVGSFLLFALGTAAALTKHRWHRPHSTP
jgi:hypothetical protein